MRRRLLAAAVIGVAMAGAVVGGEPASSQSTLNLNASYQAAAYGDVITVPAGTHGPQTIYYQATKGSEADEPDVVVRGEPGAIVQGITLYGARHLTIENLTIQGSVIYECEDSGVPTEARGQHPVDNTLRNSRVIGTTRSENAQRLIIEGNEIGPSSAVIKVGASGDTGGGNCADEAPSDITFQGNDIHNFREVSAASHMECVFVEGVQGLTFVRNKLRGCSVFSVFFKQQLAAGTFGMRDILVENNQLGCPVASAFRAAGTTSLSFSEGSYTNLTVRSNSICGNLLLRKDLPGTWTNVLVEGNLGRQVATGAPSVNVCTAAGVTVRGNAWSSSTKCAQDIASGVDRGWVDMETAAELTSPTSDPTIDYSLVSGAWAIDKASTGPATDYDGQVRPSGAAYDLGSDEYQDAPLPPPAAQCADGADNDADGKVDLDDPGCTDSADDSESPDPSPPPPQCPGESLSLSLVSETAGTVTLGWEAVSGAVGYRFSRVDQSKRPHTWDGSRTTVTFGKGAACYRVEALGLLSDGGHPR